MTESIKIVINKLPEKHPRAYKVTVFEDDWAIESLHYDTLEQAINSAEATALQNNAEKIYHSY